MLIWLSIMDCLILMALILTWVDVFGVRGCHYLISTVTSRRIVMRRLPAKAGWGAGVSGQREEFVTGRDVLLAADADWGHVRCGRDGAGGYKAECGDGTVVDDVGELVVDNTESFGLGSGHSETGPSMPSRVSWGKPRESRCLFHSRNVIGRARLDHGAIFQDANMHVWDPDSRRGAEIHTHFYPSSVPMVPTYHFISYMYYSNNS